MNHHPSMPKHTLARRLSPRGPLPAMATEGLLSSRATLIFGVGLFQDLGDDGGGGLR